MVVGKRSETYSEKVKRHIKECEDDKKGWENELEYARKNKDENYEKYCLFWINVMENTLAELRKYDLE